jgi:elongator complex protein 1
MAQVAKARFQSYLATNPWSASSKPSEVVSFRFLPDTRTLVLIMRGGDIATASLDDELLVVRWCILFGLEENLDRIP